MGQPGGPSPPGQWSDFSQPDVWTTAGFGWRVAASILIAIGWLSFVIIWLFFYASENNIFKNLAIVIVSVIVAIGILAAMWAPWGMRMAKAAGVEHPMQYVRPTLMTVVSILSGVGWLVFLIVWLFFYAGDYDGYQNLSIVILSLVVVAIINGGGWALWGIVRHRRF